MSCCYSTLQALVIIKRKPPGISAKEYATRLAVSFSQAQENWKTKVWLLVNVSVYHMMFV